MQQNAASIPAIPKTEPRNLYQEVTDRIISLIEQGTPPWRQSWSTYGLAKNYATGHIYSGINFLLMNSTNYKIPYFMTFNQVKERGGQIQKGAKGEMVIYFNVIYKDAFDQMLDEVDAKARMLSGQEIKVLKYIKYYTVFNLEHIDGISFSFDQAPMEPNEKIKRCEEILWHMPRYPTLNLGAKQPSYNPAEDCINMPTIDQFHSSEDYYVTLFHELIHSTGHESRLARGGVMSPEKFGSEAYSREELVAEIGASFLCAVAGVDYDHVVKDSASYASSWLSVLREDSKFIFKIASEAQKAADFILNLSN